MFSKKDTEALMMGLIESSLDPMFIINEAGTIHIVNKAAVKQFGFKREEFIGHNVSMIVAGEHGKRHDKYIAQYLRTGNSRVMGKKRELIAKRKDGSEFIIELSLSEVKLKVETESFFCGFVRDLTQQQHNEKMLSDLVESSFDALFAIDKKGKILRVNAASLKEFGWSRKEFIGSNITMIMAGTDAKNHHKYVANYLRTGKKKLIGIQRELVAKRKDGSTFPVWLGLQEIKDPVGEPIFVSFVRNLSDQKKITSLERERAIAETLLKQSVPDNVMRDDSSHGSDECDNNYLISTVLYAEIKRTKSSNENSAKDAREALLRLGEQFGYLIDKYHLSKMKTKSDCFMVMTVPVSEYEEVECARMCHFGLDVMKILNRHNEENPSCQFDFQAGIGTGPVATHNSLWIDAVNLSKMKHNTRQGGTIRAPAIVAEMLRDDFTFALGGNISLEGKRDLETFLLIGRKKERNVLEEIDTKVSQDAMNKSWRKGFQGWMSNLAEEA